MTNRPGTLWLREPIGSNYVVTPEDVESTKKRLFSIGYYNPPEYGITPYPDRDLFSAIKRFQEDEGLHVDGIMRPNGETETTLAARSPKLICTECGAFHGGSKSTLLCPDCFRKSNM